MGHKYVYSIIQPDRETAPRGPGLGGSAVYTLSHDGLACVLSDYSGPELEGLCKEELFRCLLAHQAVVERVMERQSVLPVKFGTLMAGDSEVRAFLWQGRQRLARALEQVQGKVEVEVAATWDMAQVLRELATQEEIGRARAAMAALPPGEAFQQRLHLGQMVKEALDQRRDSYRERMLAFLAPLALDAQPNILVSDEMVMNVAFLLPKGRQEEFDRRVGELNELFQDQIHFRIIGPLPPYSFATVEATKPSWERIEGARQILHLGECISEPQVRKAYRRLAAEAHPDSNSGNGAPREHLNMLREASATLLSYCGGQAAASEAKASYPVSPEMVSHTFLINIRRSSEGAALPLLKGEAVSSGVYYGGG